MGPGVFFVRRFKSVLVLFQSPFLIELLSFFFLFRASRHLAFFYKYITGRWAFVLLNWVNESFNVKLKCCWKQRETQRLSEEIAYDWQGESQASKLVSSPSIWLEGCRKWKERRQKKEAVEFISVLGCVLCIFMTHNHPHFFHGLLKT